MVITLSSSDDSSSSNKKLSIRGSTIVSNKINVPKLQSFFHPAPNQLKVLPFTPLCYPFIRDKFCQQHPCGSLFILRKCKAIMFYLYYMYVFSYNYALPYSCSGLRLRLVITTWWRHAAQSIVNFQSNTLISIDKQITLSLPY